MENVLKFAVAAALRVATTSYIRGMPWSAGKKTAYKLYNGYVGWRPHRATVRTRFGALMDVSCPDLVSSTIYATGQWEPVITEYIRAGLRKGDVFVDCGANIGYYSVLTSGLVGDSGAIYSIEASPRIHAILAHNVAMNCLRNVRTTNAAASSESGELKMFLAQEGNLGHSTTVESLATQEGMRFEGKVRADTLENLVGRDLWRARFVKIDVEGAECAVLSPLLRQLDRFSEWTEWMLELAPDWTAGGQADIDRIFAAFTSAGYRVYRIPNEYRPEFYLAAPDMKFERLQVPPTERCDVLMSRTYAADAS
jgi:FkbM family methyltransferase